MLEMIQGADVSCADELNEGYTYTVDNKIIANINASKIKTIVKDYLDMHSKAMFFSLQIPDKKITQCTDYDKDSNESKMDTYSIDYCTKSRCISIMDEFGDLLVNDGLNRFSFGCPETNDILTVSKYNLITFSGENINTFSEILKRNSILRNDSLTTACSTFSKKTPGKCKSFEKNNITIYDLPSASLLNGIHPDRKTEEENRISAMRIIGRVLNIAGVFINLFLSCTFLSNSNPFLLLSWPSVKTSEICLYIFLLILLYYVVDLIIHILAVRKDGKREMIRKGKKQFCIGIPLFLVSISVISACILSNLPNRMLCGTRSPDGSRYIITQQSNSEYSSFNIKKMSSLFNNTILADSQNIGIRNSDMEIAWINDNSFNIELTASVKNDDTVLYYSFSNNSDLKEITKEEYEAQDYVKKDFIKYK